MIEFETLNVEQGVRYTNDNLDLYKTILVSFYEDYKDAFIKLTQLSNNDLESCHILAHSLKGTTAIIGSEQLPPLFYAIETAAKENSTELATCIEAVKEPFSAMINELKAKGFSE
ncbi:DNA repair protein RadC [Lentisphaera araneosa HTCC2155]|jgi:HPt (histidine-containing phosphotransfer) domain-containing protein|uniref:DNA repair protein RadC n=1 Tax=Lentisphaera araneosa HTCC2155 TaxID=313628 RepID=A6DS54_9BACT|nr:Hpt domain-containing protein [Lentisphaera araneosa]EDM25514.1 DNA repair protein RadC [Lentisphaera araneosa HTCC2155]